MLLVLGGEEASIITDHVMMYDPEEEAFVQIDTRLRLASAGAVGIAVPASFCL